MTQEKNVHAPAPLILTLALDKGSQAFFDNLRVQHFPSERNYLQAHLTLFHHLPGEEKSVIITYLEKVATDYKQLLLEVTDVKKMGRGVAYKLEGETLMMLHQQLSQKWKAWLTP